VIPNYLQPRDFWNLVREDGDCWIWLGSQHHKTRNGIYCRNAKRYEAHRFAWSALIGEPPECLVRKCDKERCINPDHREPMTRRAFNRRLNGSSKDDDDHCPRGHLLDEANTYVNPRGARVCKTCRRGHYSAYYYRKRKRLQDVPPNTRRFRKKDQNSALGRVAARKGRGSAA